MDLGVGEMRKHPLLVTRTQVSHPGSMGPLVLKKQMRQGGFLFNLLFSRKQNRELFFFEIQTIFFLKVVL